MSQPPSRSAGLALAAVRAGDARQVRRQRPHARRRRHHPRPRGQRGGSREGRAPARSCRRLPKRSARAAPTCSCASTAPGTRPSATSRPSSARSVMRPDVPEGREPRAPGRHCRAARHAGGRARPAAGPHPAGGAGRDGGRLFPRCARSPRRRRASLPSRSAPRTSPPSVGMEPIGETLQAPKQTMIIAARAAGILPLGFMGTVADFDDLEAFRAIVRRSRKFGFVGRELHPPEPGADPQRGVRLVGRGGRPRATHGRGLRRRQGPGARRGRLRGQDDRRAGGRARRRP